MQEQSPPSCEQTFDISSTGVAKPGSTAMVPAIRCENALETRSLAVQGSSDRSPPERISETRSAGIAPLEAVSRELKSHDNIHRHAGPAQSATTSSTNKVEGDLPYVLGGAARFNASHAA